MIHQGSDKTSKDRGWGLQMRIFDSHVHSSNSPDAESSVMLLCEQAVAAGLSGFCVTDHCEQIGRAHV